MPTGKNDFSHIGSLVGRVLAGCQDGTAVGMREAMGLWRMAVDPVIAANTRPAAFKGRLLLVHVAGPMWIQELRFRKRELLRQLNDAAGKDVVSDIAFKVGPIE